jgi:hypothetical protein
MQYQGRGPINIENPVISRVAESDYVPRNMGFGTIVPPKAMQG